MPKALIGCRYSEPLDSHFQLHPFKIGEWYLYAMLLRVKASWQTFLFRVALTLSLLTGLSADLRSAEEPTAAAFVIPAGDRLLLRVCEDVSTRSARKGQRAELEIVHGLLLGNGFALPRGLRVGATITLAHRRRTVAILDRAELRIRFDDLVLPDGSILPVAARVLRAGFLDIESSDDGEFSIKGEGHSRRVTVMVAGSAARAALLAGPVGAAAMATVSLITLSGTRSRDVKLPRGLVFEVELTSDLRIPCDTADLEVWAPSEAPTAQDPAPSWAGEDAGKASPGIRPRAEEGGVPEAAPPIGGLTFKVQVNLVAVETVVRNMQGRLMEGLLKEDFRVFEDGVEQTVSHFSRDLLPLAIAVVIDRSGSVANHLDELRSAALETLHHLKAEDEVALFAFADHCSRLSGLTTDRARIADMLGFIQPAGGTNIYDAVFDATRYLATAAPDRRRAIILISDNQANTLGRASESGAIRLALETETVIYSVKTPGASLPAKTEKPPATHLEKTSIWVSDPESVRRIAEETGGELLDAEHRGLLSEALASIIARLKLRYTLGYTPGKSARDGMFHRLEVRLSDRFGRPGLAYTVHARRGFYAKMP